MKIKQSISIILVILWMLVVFSFSAQNGSKSSGISNKVAGKIIDIINLTNIGEQEERQIKIEKIEPVIRKMAHLTIYILGGILISNMMFQLILKNSIKLKIGISAIFGIVFAITDEIHQLFVGGRSGRIQDVIIDSIGVIIGIVFFQIIRKIILSSKEEKNDCRTIKHIYIK